MIFKILAENLLIYNQYMASNQIVYSVGIIRGFE